MNKQIAWGASKLLKMFLKDADAQPFAYCVDDFAKDQDVYGLSIKKSRVLLAESKGGLEVVIFAVSNKSIQEITRKLNTWGLTYRQGYIFYSDFFYSTFLKKAEALLGWRFDERIYYYALFFTLNSRVAVHTTILGTWLFLEILQKVSSLSGSLAEVGAYQGGNVLSALQFTTKQPPKKFYIFDSFEGFPELSKHDPQNFKKGDYNIETSFHEIQDTFQVFPQAVLLKGFVPGTFRNVPPGEQFSLVFYDCDLYQPALDTFAFFWDRIIPGGYMLVHDYQTEEGGFTGVKKATDEFFGSKKIPIISFSENTMAVIKKI